MGSTTLEQRALMKERDAAGFCCPFTFRAGGIEQVFQGKPGLCFHGPSGRGNATKHIIMTVSKNGSRTDLAKVICRPLTGQEIRWIVTGFSVPFTACRAMNTIAWVGFLIGSRPEGAAEDRAARCCV
jgi:hypothetical protein